jgi:glycosyltransferase involved in cell wall biosynthesis
VRFIGRVSDAELADYYRRCRALVYPQEEDFGIAAVEAQAAGRPVIAFGRGGALDTVRPPERSEPGRGPTGVLFDVQNAAALRDAIARFERIETDFSPREIRSWAEGFSTARFHVEFAREVEAACRGAAA